MSRSIFAVMDARAYEDPDEATVYTVSDTMEEAREDQGDYPDSVIVIGLVEEIGGVETVTDWIVEEDEYR